ncbi:MAG TPA: hypothetical protein VIM16_06655 [Mucilaginibacter sp.]|jgi:hypothetical protein
MNVLSPAPEISDNLPEMAIAYRNHPKNPVKAAGSKLTLKSARAYLYDALAESLKQNLLGPAINLEFLILSARVYIILFASFDVNYPKSVRTGDKPVTRNGTLHISNDPPFNNPLKLIFQ